MREKNHIRLWIIALCGVFLFGVRVAPLWGYNWDLKSNFPVPTLGDTKEWYKRYKPADSAPPPFKPGEILSFPQDLEKLKPFIPVDFWKVLLVPGHKLKIRETRDLSPHPAYLEASRKFSGQVKIGEVKGKRGHLMGYTAGLPFPTEAIRDNDPDAGWKLVWNWEYRWQGFEGLGAKHWEAWLQTGASVDRKLGGDYKKLYHTNRVDYTASNYMLPLAEASKYHWKQWTHLNYPFDVKDTTFVQFRYNGATVEGATHEEDGWAYIPALRRVRRISMAMRTDSFMGTEASLDDFYIFSGRPLDWEWKFIGRKKMLVPISDHLVAQHQKELYGPEKVLPIDSWELREQFMVDNFPLDPRHPYFQKILYIDTQTMYAFFGSAWDKKKDLWKCFLLYWYWSEDGLSVNPKDKGVRGLNWNYAPVWDVQSGKVTAFVGYEIVLTGAPQDGIYDKFPPEKVQTFFDINRLIRGR